MHPLYVKNHACIWQSISLILHSSAEVGALPNTLVIRNSSNCRSRARQRPKQYIFRVKIQSARRYWAVCCSSSWLNRTGSISGTMVLALCCTHSAFHNTMIYSKTRASTCKLHHTHGTHTGQFVPWMVPSLAPASCNAGPDRVQPGSILLNILFLASESSSP